MKNINLEIATTWDDLTRKQLLFVSRLFLLNLTQNKFRLIVFLKLTGVKTLPKQVVKDQVYYLFRKGRSKFMLTPEELGWFLKSVDFITSDSQLVKNYFPWFRLGLKRYFGPSKKCYNVTFLEFINTEKCLYAFNKTRKTKHLNELCAILYRPGKKEYHPMRPDYNGDRRETFNDYIYQKRAKLFWLIGKRKKYAVYIFYSGCRNALIAAHPKLFSAGSVSSEPVNPVKSLQGIMHDLNMGDITKNKKIQNIQVWEAFGQLEEMIKKLPKAKTK